MGEARGVAAAWVQALAAARPDVVGAFFSGSTVGLDPAEELAATSDVDVAVVLNREQVPMKPGKVLRNGILIEVTYLAGSDLADRDLVADTYVLAPSFATDTILYDPTGVLRSLHDHISADFADPERVRRRVVGVQTKIRRGLAHFDSDAPWANQVTQWLFASSLATHAVLVAALVNPTVRLRYPATRRVLQEYGLDGLYPELLGLIGCAAVDEITVAEHLGALAVCFDEAAGVARTPFFFSTDITAEARSIAIDGSQQLIDGGEHREAVFWILATFARCQQILAVDASPEVAARWAASFAAAAADLCGVVETADLIRGAKRDLATWPTVQAATEDIIAVRPVPPSGAAGAPGSS